MAAYRFMNITFITLVALVGGSFDLEDENGSSVVAITQSAQNNESVAEQVLDDDDHAQNVGDDYYFFPSTLPSSPSSSYYYYIPDYIEDMDADRYQYADDWARDDWYSSSYGFYYFGHDRPPLEIDGYSNGEEPSADFYGNFNPSKSYDYYYTDTVDSSPNEEIVEQHTPESIFEKIEQVKISEEPEKLLEELVNKEVLVLENKFHDILKSYHYSPTSITAIFFILLFVTLMVAVASVFVKKAFESNLRKGYAHPSSQDTGIQLT
jgi:hypothetical protein